jgi:ketosteroid isomerase-like protein
MKPATLTRFPIIGISMAILITNDRLSAQTPSAVESVRESVQAFYDAYNEHEFDKLAQYTKHYRRETSACDLPHVTDTPEEIAVQLATPDVAIATVRSRSSTFTTPNGVVHENEIRIRTFVVVQREGQWLIVQDQNTAQT